MLGYLVRRLISAVLVLALVSIAVFALFTYGPRDPAESMCPESHCTAQRLESIRENLGLDRPFFTQYGEYMKGIVAGREINVGTKNPIECDVPCFGRSFKYGVNVWDYLKPRMPATFSVAIGGAVFFLVIGLSFGVFAARRRGTLADRGIVGVSLLINAIPYYLLALIAYLYLVSKFGLFPDSGYVPFTDNPGKWLYALLLPWLCLGLTYSTQYARFSRGSMIEALSDDYVRTARAKGLAQRTVVFRHALRVAIVPIVTIFGLDLATLLAGTIFTEQIFGVQGMGLANLQAINIGDLPIIEATVLIAAFFVVASNVIVDLLYSVLDPRVRLA